MRLGIDLGQLVSPASGGIVYLVQGILKALFGLAPEDRFVVYRAPASCELLEPLPANVTRVLLRAESFWRDLGSAAIRDRVDVLFRSYPIDEPVAFPMDRQLFMIPDLLHETLPATLSTEIVNRRRLAFAAAISKAGAIAVLSEEGCKALQSPCATCNIVAPGASLPFTARDPGRRLDSLTSL